MNPKLPVIPRVLGDILYSIESKHVLISSPFSAAWRLSDLLRQEHPIWAQHPLFVSLTILKMCPLYNHDNNILAAIQSSIHESSCKIEILQTLCILNNSKASISESWNPLLCRLLDQYKMAANSCNSWDKSKVPVDKSSKK